MVLRGGIMSPLRIVLSVSLSLALLTVHAAPLCAQRVGGGHGEEELSKWPKPEVAAGMSELEAAAAFKLYVDRLVADDRFSGAVLLAKDGKTFFSKAWGSADVAHTAANAVDTRFNLGSINKIFTQVAIAQLAQSGKLALGDTVRKWLPDYPSPVADQITIEQLVAHRSGLGDFIGGPYFDLPPSKLRRLSDFLPLFVGKPLEFEPGTSQRYSNAGYIVLGLIIEKASGQSYYDYVRDHVTSPSGMKSTDSYFVDASVPSRAEGMSFRGLNGMQPKRVSNLPSLPGRPSSAGGGYSTVEDLLRFTEALQHERLLSRKWTNWIFQQAPDYAGERHFGIGGGAIGINAVVLIETPYTVIVLSNFDPPAAEGVGKFALQFLGVAGRREKP
jgi:D-alanyl-D-alanine carboxypeptidase